MVPAPPPPLPPPAANPKTSTSRLLVRPKRRQRVKRRRRRSGKSPSRLSRKSLAKTTLTSSSKTCSCENHHNDKTAILKKVIRTLSTLHHTDDTASALCVPLKTAVCQKPKSVTGAVTLLVVLTFKHHTDTTLNHVDQYLSGRHQNISSLIILPLLYRRHSFFFFGLHAPLPNPP